MRLVFLRVSSFGLSKDKVVEKVLVRPTGSLGKGSAALVALATDIVRLSVGIVALLDIILPVDTRLFGGCVDIFMLAAAEVDMLTLTLSATLYEIKLISGGLAGA